MRGNWRCGPLLNGGRLAGTVEHSVKKSMLDYYDVHANDYDCVYSGEFSGSELVGSKSFVVAWKWY